mmetsp:Transcript_115057/g.181648  ORF Transcript_115057/g.181648 Transcript_115057/m.181648 type:complete len:656 (-) Transcript_115057:127-2094(-)
MIDPVVLTAVSATVPPASGSEHSDQEAADLNTQLASKGPVFPDKDSSCDSSASVLHDAEQNNHEALHSARSILMETPPFTKPFPAGSVTPQGHDLPKLNLASAVDLDPFSNYRPSKTEFRLGVAAHTDAHAEPPPTSPSSYSLRIPEGTKVREQSREDRLMSARQPLMYHPAFIDNKDPLGEVLDWLGHSDIGINQLAPEVGNTLMDEGRTHSFDFVALEDDGTSARAQIPREWPPKQAQPHLQMLTKCSTASAACIGDSKRLSAERYPSERLHSLLAEDEEEWLQRQQRTGTVGRLVIYAANENPQEDVVLRGGSGRPLIVTSVSECGPASRAGIKAGDRLASINGKKHFTGLSADAVRAQLFHPPLMLVFLGFVGKLQAEVRLTSAIGICGMPLRRDVLRGQNNAPIEVCEQTIFHAAAPLFLTVRENTESVVESLGALFELQRREAASIVQNALVHAMHDGPIPLPATPVISRMNTIDSRMNTITSTASAPVAKVAAPHGQEEPLKPGGDVGSVEDTLCDAEQDYLELPMQMELQQPEHLLQQQQEKEETKETHEGDEAEEVLEEAKSDQPDCEEDGDMLRVDHHIPRIPGMMFPATDRVIGAGLTPRTYLFNRAEGTRTLAQRGLNGPRASKPLGPCVVDPDNYRLERFCA